jgi:hypothetical protein
LFFLFIHAQSSFSFLFLRWYSSSSLVQSSLLICSLFPLLFNLSFFFLCFSFFLSRSIHYFFFLVFSVFLFVFFFFFSSIFPFYFFSYLFLSLFPSFTTLSFPLAFALQAKCSPETNPSLPPCLWQNLQQINNCQKIEN